MNEVDKIIPLLQENISLNILLSILIILVLWLINKIVHSILEKKISDVKSNYKWKKTTSYISVFLGFILVGRIWFEGIQSLATFLGLLSAGLAIALKDVISNFAGWLFIMWRKPFLVGNRIQIGNHSGDVIDIRPFQFTILEIGNWVKADQSTGRMIHIPNNLIFTQPQCNYDYGFKYIWNEIPVLITFESDWAKAKEILKNAADKNALELTAEAEEQIKQAAKKFLIFYNKLTPKVYTSVEDSGVLLTIRYLTEIRKRRTTTELIWEEILREFARYDDINLAYPTYRRVEK
jgi:small-conductance mechanosensitive channel